MADHRYLVRTALRTVLADVTYGFNAVAATLQAKYGIAGTVALDWGAGSESVLIGELTSLQPSSLKGELVLLIVTGASVWTGETKGVKWSGLVDAELQFRVEFSGELGDSETEIDISMAEPWTEFLEDVVTEVLGRKSIDWSALKVVQPRPADCPSPQGIEPTDNGWWRLVPIRVSFRVDVT